MTKPVRSVRNDAMASTKISAEERRILRELGKRKNDIGGLPVQAVKARLWRDLNGLRPCRPAVWINEIPWNEMTPQAKELQTRCQDPFLASIETALRQELYQWDHFACDMVVEPVIFLSIVGGPTSVYADYGLEAHNLGKAGAEDVLFEPLMRSMADAERVKTPKVWYDREETRRRLELLRDVFDGVIEIRQRGIVHQWHTPWDMAVRWYGVEQLFIDMYDQPELVAAVCKRVAEATGTVLDRQQELGMLDVGNGNWRVGSGGMGYTDELPETLTGRAATPKDQWGCGNAQIFSEVSPEMHEEFSLRFERPVMERFGLTYYGCCEPLHTKLGILKSVRNLRKISMSPKADLRMAAQATRGRYVLSFKPNPAQLAPDTFRPEQVRSYLRESLEQMEGASVEIILKDVTTIRGELPRLDGWASTAMEVVQGL